MHLNKWSIAASPRTTTGGIFAGLGLGLGLGFGSPT